MKVMRVTLIVAFPKRNFMFGLCSESMCMCASKLRPLISGTACTWKRSGLRALRV